MIAVGHRCASVACQTRIASTVAATSCTRTPQTPASTASTVVASVAASRWSTGRGVPSGDGQQLAQVGLAARREQHREPERDDRVEMRAEQRQLCSAVFAKPRPGSTMMLVRVDPGRERRVGPLAQLRADLGDDVVVGRELGHLARVAAPVHQDPRAAGARRRPWPCRGSARPPETSLTSTAPASSAAAATAARVVSMLTGTPAVGELADDRHDPGDLGVGVDAAGARAGRLAADVDRRAAPCARMSERVRDRGVPVGIAAAVGERVRRDVEDAHDHGRIRRPSQQFVRHSCHLRSRRTRVCSRVRSRSPATTLVSIRQLRVMSRDPDHAGSYRCVLSHRRCPHHA